MGISSALIWGIIGAVLIIADIFSATFVFVFFGIGAMITALTTWSGITPQLSGQLLCFASTSLVTMLLFRKTARKFFGKTGETLEYNEFIGQKVSVTKSIPAGGEGSVSYRGTEWIAFSDSKHEISAGDTVEIISVEGIKLKIKPLQDFDLKT
jgi:membrane protein implicated in regulation of membrane protease activity